MSTVTCETFLIIGLMEPCPTMPQPSGNRWDTSEAVTVRILERATRLLNARAPYQVSIAARHRYLLSPSQLEQRASKYGPNAVDEHMALDSSVFQVVELKQFQLVSRRFMLCWRSPKALLADKLR